MSAPAAAARGVEAAGYVIFPGATVGEETVYAGSRKTAAYTTGTITTTTNSTVVGVGSSWSANVDPGMLLLTDTESDLIGIVKSVESNTALTLLRPASMATAGVAYRLAPAISYSLARNVSGVSVAAPTVRHYLAVAGQRLLRCYLNKVEFSAPISDANFVPSDRHFPGLPEAEHELPLGATIVGADGLGDSGVIFTTGGVWVIDNLTLDAVDDYGNVQHTVRQVTKDVILWGDSGIAAWSGALIVPAIDDVYLLGLDGQPVPVSASIRPLYREYVEAGYQPGIASVYRGHYMLPVLNGTTLVDVLACRLDLSDRNGRRPAWTRWANHAAGLGYATRIGGTTRTPKLFGLAGQRVTDLTGCFDPDAARDDDAEGTDHQLTVETRDFDLTGTNRKPGTAEKAELVYELVGSGCTVALSWASGEEGSSYTALTAIRGGGTSDGSDYSVWAVNKARRSVRLKIVQSGAAAKMILRRVAIRVRGAGL